MAPDREAQRVFAPQTRVKYTDKALARMREDEAKRMRGRTGTVTGYRAGAIDPIVVFPKDGRRKELKLFELNSQWLEAVPDTTSTQNEKHMDRDTLIAGGFVPTTYDGQEGEFLTKRTRIEQMPYASKHLPDDEILGTSEAITEIVPGGMVQFCVPDGDYVEGPIPLDSDEGRALVQDALDAK